MSRNYHFRYLGWVQVKGKEQPIKAFECIDGDEPQIQQGKLDTLTQYQQGLDLFYEKEFAEATALFAQVLKHNPEDRVAAYFRDLAAKYTHEGVGENWSGMERLVE